MNWIVVSDIEPGYAEAPIPDNWKPFSTGTLLQPIWLFFTPCPQPQKFHPSLRNMLTSFPFNRLLFKYIYNLQMVDLFPSVRNMFTNFSFNWLHFKYWSSGYQHSSSVSTFYYTVILANELGMCLLLANDYLHILATTNWQVWRVTLLQYLMSLVSK